ncbi:SDR family oxidoreductase [Nocardia gamkensis]|uniref:SDR family oxidoreductase n=1 Tax=Nocardia gamkensis TaxID=352869 RepID=UPI0037C6C77D
MATAGRVALVTGGTGGIGARIVSRLAREGYWIAIHYAGKPGRAGEAAAAIRAAGGRAIAVGGDIADEVRMAALFDEVSAEFSVTRLQFPNYSAYAGSKGAVEAMTLVLARELRGRDITVNAVAPGPTATPLFLTGKSDDDVAALAQVAPLERIGTPDDIAESVAFLAGPARWINGQTIFANGGAA